MREFFLGLPGPWADDNLEASDHYTTKIGGLPDWPFHDSSSGLDLLQCSSCRSNLCLVSQVYAPISSADVKIENRVIYVFGCTNAHCGSWRAIRVQKPDHYEESKASNSKAASLSLSSVPASDTKWWDDLYSFESEGEDFGDNEEMNLEELGRALSEAASLASGSGKQNVKKKNETIGNLPSLNPKFREVDVSVLVLPCFYIYIQEDRSSRDLAAVCSSLSIKKFQDKKDNDDQIQEEDWEEEGYEYDKALNADRTYLKFKKRVDACPEQCFRYSFGGKPLLASGQVGDPGLCGLCGGTRQYEMQLMPPLLYFLQERATGWQKDLLENWCWMTLIVYTCSKSCFQKADKEKPNWHGWTVAEETVIPQFEKPLTESSRLGS